MANRPIAAVIDPITREILFENANTSSVEYDGGIWTIEFKMPKNFGQFDPENYPFNPNLYSININYTQDDPDYTQSSGMTVSIDNESFSYINGDVNDCVHFLWKVPQSAALDKGWLWFAVQIVDPNDKVWSTKPKRIRVWPKIWGEEAGDSEENQTISTKTWKELTYRMDVLNMQDRIRNQGFSRLPLQVNDAYCEVLKDSGGYLWPYSPYRPRALFSWLQKMIWIGAALKTINPIDATSDDDIPILFGLPTIFSPIGVRAAIIVHPPTGQSFVVNGKYTTYRFARVWGEDSSHPDEGHENDAYLNDLKNPHSDFYDPDCTTAYVRKTAEYFTYENNDWVRRYTPAGSFEINYINSTRSSAFSIPVGSILEISQAPISMVLTSGGNNFPRIYQQDIERVSAWIKSHRGLFDYSNNGIRRRELVDPVTSGEQTFGATDCSGMIHMAFRCGAGKWVPDGTKTMIGYGKPIAFASEGEELNTSLLEEGDIVGFIEAEASPRVANCHHVAIVVRGMPDDPNDDTLRLWHQTTTFCCYNGEKQPWMQKNDDVIQSYQQFIQQSIVTPQRLQKDAQGHVIPDTYEDNMIVFGPQPCCAAASRSNGIVYTDANYSLSNARIVVRWKDDSQVLRDAPVIDDDDPLGGDYGTDDDDSE